MRLMARIARYATRMFLGFNLLETFGLGFVGLVTAAAKIGCDERLRLVRDGIVGVLVLRTVARFAGNAGMPARRAHLDDRFVAHGARILPGIGERSAADILEC
jgi:hypothetical protein